ncbi:MAG TPA: prolyl oligopeptidase family serine peptidase [Phycisphaerales bacterium]|nr:prolyl oligopeptidase family serine peptidase [Phycisphaerales bacterium]
MSRLLPALGVLLALACSTSAQEVIRFSEGLAIQRLAAGGRQPFFSDPITLALVRGQWTAPAAGQTLPTSSGEQAAWHPLAPDDDGWFREGGLAGGYLLLRADLEAPSALILEAQGSGIVYVNGEPRAGDPYSNGLLRLPIALRQGANELLFSVARGQLRAQLVSPEAPIAFDTVDFTLPDQIEGENGDLWAGVPLLNATPQDATELTIRAVALQADGAETVQETAGVRAPRLTVYKAPVKLPHGAADAEGNVPIKLQILRAGETLHTREIKLRARRADERHIRTFVSDIDGSVQYFAVTPRLTPAEGRAAHDSKPALVLSLHGASVEAAGQAEAYEPKEWAHIVAPTNRRPFGFDWEDWGRLDAIEALDRAVELFDPDPSRIYLTGHSMGGHGTWQLAAHFPGRFAAIAPSAGWISFFSYGGLPAFDGATPVHDAFARAASPSDTLSLLDNYAGLAVYILHGDADENVPVTEARAMRSHLAGFHRNFAYYEQPGAGHWWGNQCVDWPPLFAHFRFNTRPARPDHLRFATAAPGVSGEHRWATVLEQLEPMKRSRIDLSLDAAAGTIKGHTENVARLALSMQQCQRPISRTQEDGTAIEVLAPAPGEPLFITIDDQTVELTPKRLDAPIRLSRLSGGWALDDAPHAGRKRPEREGPFKNAFRRRALLVYGTAGTAEENAWAYAKARLDAETFKYRGNGAFQVVSDRELLGAPAQSPLADPDRNIVLYGNAATNAAWSAVLADDVLMLTREAVGVGSLRLASGDHALLAVRPRAGSDLALVGVVGGTSLAACRATDRLPYFVSGVAYPDFTVFTPEVYERGIDGVVHAGFFAGDWSAPSADPGPAGAPAASLR